MLKLANVHSGYGAIEVLHGISLDINDGEIVALLGANGAGKSTTLMTISKIIDVREGKIEYNGRDVTGFSAEQMVKLGICHVPEGRRIFPELTLEENLRIGAYSRKKSKDLEETMEHIFSLFPMLKERRKQSGGSLSGGEQQMLAIGRALMAKPRILLLDEPSLGLAPKVRDEVFDIIPQIAKENTGVLLVEQNAHASLAIADRAYVMEIGTIMFSGKSSDVLKNEELVKAYLT